MRRLSHCQTNPGAIRMSLSERIAPELPYLRRFARALSGSQQSGDAYVVAMLEALVADNSLFPKDIETKPAVFRTFLKVWNSISVNSTDPGGASASAADIPERRLEAISHRARQAFLLVAVEGLSPANAAVALDTTPEDVRALIHQAGNEIAEQVATTVLIIEDEPLIALDLADIVTSIGHTVCATASTHKAAVAAFAKQKPGLVLADMQLADGSSGLEAVNESWGLSRFQLFSVQPPLGSTTSHRPPPSSYLPGSASALTRNVVSRFSTRAPAISSPTPSPNRDGME